MVRTPIDPTSIVTKDPITGMSEAAGSAHESDTAHTICCWDGLSEYITVWIALDDMRAVSATFVDPSMYSLPLVFLGLFHTRLVNFLLIVSLRSLMERCLLYRARTAATLTARRQATGLQPQAARERTTVRSWLTLMAQRLSRTLV